MWDSNLVKANPKYLSVNWDASGGGAFAVIPLGEEGKLPELIPLFRGHTGPVLDTDWNPFDDDMVVSGSDDASIGVYKVPDNFTTRTDTPEEIKDVLPIKYLKGHSKKVGHVLFHPVAENILASASGDYTVKIWNIETEQCLATLVHTDLITSLCFNENGSLLATISRDKILRVWDVRENKIISEGKAHNGAKSQRLVWLGGANRLATTGFDRSDRQYALWDVENIEQGPLGGFQRNGASSGISMPFFDEGTNMLYFIGKGDGNIQYFEYADDQLYPLSEYQSTEPQRGVAVLPRRALSVRDHEIFRVYKTINDNSIEPLSFIVPRKADTFQNDVYPEAKAGEPALTAEEWWEGKDSNPKVISMASVFEGEEATPVIGINKQASVESLPKTPVAPKSPKAEKKETPKKETLEKEEEPKKEKKEIATSSPSSDGKNIDQVLTGAGVDKMLGKANDAQDVDPRQADHSSWESGDDEPVIRKSEPLSTKEKEPIKEEPKIEEEPKVEGPKKQQFIKKEPGSESDQNSLGTPSEFGKSSATSSTNPNSAAVVSATSNSNGNVTANETVDLTNDEDEGEHQAGSLHDKINKLTSIVEKLAAKLQDRDDKIDRLETKIDQMYKK